MMLLSCSLLLTTLLGALPATSTPTQKKPAPDLLQNPSFETGELVPWTQISYPYGDAVILENGAGLPGAETPYGEYFLSLLIASPHPATFGQNLTLHPQRTYTISYAFKILLWSASSANFSVSYAGETIDTVAVSPAQNGDWKNYTSTFVPCERKGVFAFEVAVGDGSAILGIDALGVGKSGE